jgi:hypothetical protein
MKTVRYAVTAALGLAVGYFFYLEFQKNADALRQADLTLHPGYLSAAVTLGLAVYLIGPFLWRIYVNRYVSRKLTFAESLALYNTSALFKYVPGKIWTYAAQIALMSERGIPPAVLIYINIVCFVCLGFVGVTVAAGYYLFSEQILPTGISVLIFVSFIGLDAVFIIWHTKILNHLITFSNRLFSRTIEPIDLPRSLFVYTQAIYLIACVLLGAALYLLARGLHIYLPLAKIFASMATVSVSAIAGYVAFFTMGGLGVREGTMFFLLKQFSNVQAALILPLVARGLTLAVELAMGLLGFVIGVKYNCFPKWRTEMPDQLPESKAQIEIRSPQKAKG